MTKVNILSFTPLCLSCFEKMSRKVYNIIFTCITLSQKFTVTLSNPKISIFFFLLKTYFLKLATDFLHPLQASFTFALVTDWKISLGFIIFETMHTLSASYLTLNPSYRDTLSHMGWFLLPFFVTSVPLTVSNGITKFITTTSIRLIHLPSEFGPSTLSLAPEPNPPSSPPQGMSTNRPKFDPFAIEPREPWDSVILLTSPSHAVI